MVDMGDRMDAGMDCLVDGYCDVDGLMFDVLPVLYTARPPPRDPYNEAALKT